MRTVVMIVIGLIGGFLGGLILSELIGIVGVLLFDRAVGIRFLPLYLAVVCAAAWQAPQGPQSGQRER